MYNPGMAFEIYPFGYDFLPQAAELLAQRQRQDCATLPELPARFSDPEIARAAVQAALDRPHAAGVAAVEEGRLLGYLIGDLALDMLWGRAAWVRLAGYALAPGADVELMRDLYAVLGSDWVNMGVYTHLVQISPSQDALVRAWFSLSFGIEQISGLRDLSTSLPLPNPPEGVQIRRATGADAAALRDLSSIIWRYQIEAPVWGITLPEHVADIRQGYAELPADPDATVWLAEKHGQPLGFAAFLQLAPDKTNPLVPENCVELSVAGTSPQMRGQGIGKALALHGIEQARLAGARFCLTDWRSANLLSSRFWPYLGFNPVMLRLARRVDSRIAWARGQS